jgi:hypothetical protein
MPEPSPPMLRRGMNSLPAFIYRAVFLLPELRLSGVSVRSSLLTI